MKLREKEFYEQYHQHGGTTIIPTEIFNELYDDATEEIERLKEELKYTVPIVEHNKTITKHLKEIERLNNIIDKINKLYDCNTNCENIYYAIGVLLNKKYCDIKDVLEEDLLDILKGSDKE